MTTKCEDIASKVTLVDAEFRTPLLGGAIRLRSCSVNIGIGDGSSSIRISLVTDNCIGGVPTLPPVGTPAIFTCGELVFGGIITTLSYSESSNGFEYTVGLTDPKKILAGVSVLLTSYFCDPIIPGNVVKNFINVNGLLEKGVAVCPPGEASQNWPRIGACANFGLAGGNSQGPLLWMVLQKIQADYSGLHSLYTTSGRRIYLSLGPLVGLLQMNAPYARAPGTSSSLGQLITTACDYISCDYIVLLVGIYATVTIIDRTVPPSPGYIQSLITLAQSEGNLINATIGKDETYELSNNFVLGDNVNYLAERYNTKNTPFAMMLGEDVNGEPVRVYDENFTAKINITPILDILSAGGFAANLPNMFSIKEEELLSCGSLSAWRTYGLFAANGASLSSNIAGILGFKGQLGLVIDAIARLVGGGGPSPKKKTDDINTVCGSNLVYTNQNKRGNSILVEKQVFDWLDNFVKTYYGRHWLIPMNTICMTPDNQATIKVRAGELYDLTDEPVSNGYPSPTQQNIMGLRYGVDTAIFEEETSGKIKAFITVDKNVVRNIKVNGRIIPNQIDLSELSSDHTRMFGQKLYVAASVDGTMYRNRLKQWPEVLLITDLVPMAISNKALNITRGLRAFSYLFGEGLGTFRKENLTDADSVNALSFKGASAGIQSAVVPMKSNVYVYGPWFSSAGALGSTNIKKDSALNPWTCGGYANMEIVGEASAKIGVRPSNEEESGSMELAEPPGYSIQSFLGAGVLIEAIVVSYRDGGATTSYTFRQHAQKFGNYNQVLAEMLKKGVEERNIILGRLRKDRLEKQGRVIGVLKDVWKQEHIMDKASPGFCLVGRYVTPIQTEAESSIPTSTTVKEQGAMKCTDMCSSPTSTPNTANSPITEDNSYDVFLFDPNDWGSMVGGAAEADVQNYAALSIDAIFAPVSLLGRGGRLPRYVSNWSTTATYSRTRPAMPPINSHTPLAINQKYLNPILSKAIVGSWDNRKTYNDDGVYIDRISFGTDIRQISIYDKDRYATETDFGFFSLKGPLVLQSWGYDTENKPIPNAVDTEGNAIKGKFVNSKLKNTFMGNWLKNPKTWPVGPIDLRYDRERGVWVSPPAERVVVAQLKEKLSPRKSALAVLLNPKSGDKLFYDEYHIDGKDGEDLGSEMKCEITVFDYLGNTIKAGTTVYAMHNDQKYIVIGSNSNPDLIKKTGYPITADNDCVSCEEEPEEFCEHDACGLSDCIKDLYGRTLLPVKEDGITQDTSVAIPWGSLVEGVGPFGRKSKLPAGSSFASGVLGIDPNGCLKIYLLTNCGPAPATPSASPKPAPAASESGAKIIS